MAEISHKERLKAVLKGERPDRIPVALWRHFPVDDQDPIFLAESIFAFQQEYNFDFIKVTPASSYCLKDWGIQDVWEGNPEGTRKYIRYAIAKPEDWERLPILDPHSGSLGAQLESLLNLRKKTKNEVPVVQTIFNPLAQAKNLAGEELLIEHLHQCPEAVRAGLDRITQSTVRFTQACMEIGVDGIFLAVQHASPRILSAVEYRQWGTADDMAILKMASNAWLNILHLHGDAVMFDLAVEYPVQVVNWHDREAGPSLREGNQQSGKVVCGGWRQWQTIALGNPDMVRNEAKDAREQMEGKHLILGTGCVTPIISPRACLQAAAHAGKGINADG